jgi:hypothetical protein
VKHAAPPRKNGASKPPQAAARRGRRVRIKHD